MPGSQRTASTIVPSFGRSAILAVVLAGLLLPVLPLSAPTTSAAVPGFFYQRPITISNSGSALTDYQVLVENPVFDETGLVGSWHFDTFVGTTTPDSSLSGLTATLINGVGQGAGKFGNATTFVGGSPVQRVEIADAPPLNPQSAVTVAAWVKPTNAVADQFIISKGPGDSNVGPYEIMLTQGHLRVHANTGGGQNTDGNTTLSNGAWHFIAMTYDGSALRSFVDGAQDGYLPATGSLVTASQPVTIGARAGTNVLPFDGAVDEVRIYRRALTEAEIQALYQARVRPNYDDLRFADTSGSILPHWQEADGRFWVRMPSLPNGATTIRAHYGNLSAATVSNGDATFDFFDDFSGALDPVTWGSVGTSSVSNGRLTVQTGAAYTKGTIASQPGVVVESKLRWLQFPGGGNSYSGLNIADKQSTAGSNARLVYYMSAPDSSGSITGWAATGGGGYNIVTEASQFIAAPSTWYTLSHTVRTDSVVFFKDRLTTNSYSGTWSAAFYVFLGQYSGSANEYQVADTEFDWVLTRKDASSPPAVVVGTEESASSSPPSTLAAVDPPPGPGGWHRSSVNVTLNCTPPAGESCTATYYGIDTSPTTPYSAPFPVSADGEHTVRYYSTASGNGQEAPNTLLVPIDATPPEVRIDPLCSQPANNGWCHETLLNATADDTVSGLAPDSLTCSVDGQPQRCEAPVTADGMHDVEAEASDVAGNAANATATTPAIDNTPPLTLLSAVPEPDGANGWWHTLTEVSLNATDALSGVNVTWYRVNGGPWNAYFSPFPVSDEGANLVDFYSEDVAGNVEAMGTARIGIDRTPPSLSATLDPAVPNGNLGWYKAPGARLVLEAADTPSGIDGLAYGVEGSLDHAYNGPATVPDGTHTLLARATDASGLVAFAATQPYRQDTRPPITEAFFNSTFGGSGTFGDDLEIFLTAEDPGAPLLEVSGLSPLGAITFVLDDEEPQTYANPIAVGQGDHRIAYWAEDLAGNVETTTEVLFHVIPLGDIFKIELQGNVTYTRERETTITVSNLPTDGAYEMRFNNTECPEDEVWEDAWRPVEPQRPWTLTDLNAIKRVCGQFRPIGGGTPVEQTDDIFYIRESSYFSGPDQGVFGTIGGVDPFTNVTWFRSAVNTSIEGNGSGEDDRYNFLDALRFARDADGPFDGKLQYVDEAEDTSVWLPEHQSASIEDDGTSVRQGARSLKFAFVRSPTALIDPNPPSFLRDDTLNPVDLSAYNTMSVWAIHAVNIAGASSGLLSDAPPVRFIFNPGQGDSVTYERTIARGTWSLLTFPETNESALPEILTGIRIVFPQRPTDINPVETAFFWFDAFKVYRASDLTEAREGIHVWQAKAETLDPVRTNFSDSLAIHIDTTAPTTNATATGLPGTNSWTRSDAVVTLVADDTYPADPAVKVSGVTRLNVSVDGGDVEEHNFTNQRTETVVLDAISAEGNHTVRFRSTDIAGNVEEERNVTFKIDQFPPITEATSNQPDPQQTGWYIVKPVEAYLDSSDNTSGVDRLEWQENDGPVNVDADGSVALVYDHDGEYVLTFHAVDVANNTEVEHKNAVRIDTHAPITTANVTGVVCNAWYDEDGALVRLAATDPNPDNANRVSGVRRTLYKLDEGDFQVYAEPFPVQGEGVHVVAFYSEDKAGNIEVAQELDLKIDGTPPDARITFRPMEPDGDNDWYRQSVNVSIVATDTPSGPKSITYRVATRADAGSFVTVEGALAEFDLVDDDEYTITFFAEDMACNLEAPEDAEVRIDATPPLTLGEHTFVEHPPMNGWYNGSVAVTLNATDATSGINITTYSVDGGDNVTYNGTFLVSGDGEHRVNFSSMDHAGNEEDIRNLTFLVDQTPPVTTLLRDPAEPNGDNGWYATPVNLSFEATDNATGSGVANITYELLLSGTSLQNGTFNGTPIPAAQDGANYTVKYNASDLAGNVEALQEGTFRIDATLPEVRVLSQTPSDLTTVTVGGVTVKAFAKDNLSGLTGPPQLCYAYPDTGLTCIAMEPAAVEHEFEATIPAPQAAGQWHAYGNLALEYHVNGTDIAGNIGLTDLVQELIDFINEPPEVRVVSPNGFEGWAGTHDITWTANDTAANETLNLTYKVELLTVDGSVTTATLFEGERVTLAFAWDTTGHQDGRRYKVRVTATDPSGTAVFDESDERFTVDNTAPDSSLLPLPPEPTGTNGWYNGATPAVSVAINATDFSDTAEGRVELTGVGKVEYRIDNETWENYTEPLVFAEDGRYFVESRAEDLADAPNQQDLATAFYLNLDRTPPNSTCVVVPPAAPLPNPLPRPPPACDDLPWQDSVVRMNFSATDNLSGVAKLCVRSYIGAPGNVGFTCTNGNFTERNIPGPGAVSGNYTVEYFAADVAGNNETVHSFLLQYDKESPNFLPGETPRADSTAGMFARISVKYGDQGAPNQSGIDLETAYLFVDGVNFTELAVQQGGRTLTEISYTPTAPWACVPPVAGIPSAIESQEPVTSKGFRHTVQVQVSDVAGNTSLKTWVFYVSAPGCVTGVVP